MWSGLTDCAFETFENSVLENLDSYAPKKMGQFVTERPKYFDHECTAAESTERKFERILKKPNTTESQVKYESSVEL